MNPLWAEKCYPNISAPEIQYITSYKNVYANIDDVRIASEDKTEPNTNRTIFLEILAKSLKNKY